MAASYGYVYVAQVSMGANQAQYFKALKEGATSGGRRATVVRRATARRWLGPKGQARQR